MGAWWNLDIGKHPAPVFGKNAISDKLMLLFTDADQFLDQAKAKGLAEFEREAEDPDVATDDIPQTWHVRLMGYEAAAGTLRSRLELQGLSSERVRSMCSSFFEEGLAFDVEHGFDGRDRWPQGHSTYPDGASVAAGVASRRGQAAATALGPKTDPEQQFLEGHWESLRESFDDPRFALAVCLMNTRAETKVTIDLTHLVLEGWMAVDDKPHRDARDRLAAAVAASGPVIVIAEGASDTRWLRRSLEIAEPASAHLFEFLDFDEFRSPGGTDRVVSLTKGMASAKVMNRIVAVLDNDTAGRLAADQLKALDLPPRIAVTSLPDVSYVVRYPTLGPAGSATADVNGRAATIEFMFGDDILRDADGTLFPVRWHSYIESAGEYQGRLGSQHKSTVGERIDLALKGEVEFANSDQVLAGCRRLAAMLLAAAGPPKYIPASEFSDLTSSWRMSQ